MAICGGGNIDESHCCEPVVEDLAGGAHGCRQGGQGLWSCGVTVQVLESGAGFDVGTGAGGACPAVGVGASVASGAVFFVFVPHAGQSCLLVVMGYKRTAPGNTDAVERVIFRHVGIG